MQNNCNADQQSVCDPTIQVFCGLQNPGTLIVLDREEKVVYNDFSSHKSTTASKKKGKLCWRTLTAVVF
jgi:hypothetical protein